MWPTTTTTTSTNGQTTFYFPISLFIMDVRDCLNNFSSFNCVYFETKIWFARFDVIFCLKRVRFLVDHVNCFGSTKLEDRQNCDSQRYL